KNNIEKFQRDYRDLQEELEDKIDTLNSKFELKNYPIEPYQIRPKKRDITIKDIALIWRNY
ncbi:MAG: hypothetical protein U9R50_03450, partial [Campylobacterota bacterium]|nr:hypothetical protein [Campylobacterota bacterium]